MDLRLGWLVVTGVVALAATGPIERRLSRRGWDVPRHRSDRPLFGGIWFTLAFPVFGWLGVFLVLPLALGSLWLYVWTARRTPSGPGRVTSSSGERAVRAYLDALASVVPVLERPPPGSTPDRISIDDVGLYERLGDRWEARLAGGSVVMLVLQAEGRAEFTSRFIAHHAASVGDFRMSEGLISAALDAMSERGVVDPVRDGWYTVQVRWVSTDEAARRPR